jgi:hypothetical protein
VVSAAALPAVGSGRATGSWASGRGPGGCCSRPAKSFAAGGGSHSSPSQAAAIVEGLAGQRWLTLLLLSVACAVEWPAARPCLGGTLGLEAGHSPSLERKAEKVLRIQNGALSLTSRCPTRRCSWRPRGLTLPGTAAERISVGHAESLGSWRVLLNLEGFEASELSLGVCCAEAGPLERRPPQRPRACCGQPAFLK